MKAAGTLLKKVDGTAKNSLQEDIDQLGNHYDRLAQIHSKLGCCTPCDGDIERADAEMRSAIQAMSLMKTRMAKLSVLNQDKTPEPPTKRSKADQKPPEAPKDSSL